MIFSEKNLGSDVYCLRYSFRAYADPIFSIHGKGFGKGIVPR